MIRGKKDEPRKIDCWNPDLDDFPNENRTTLFSLFSPVEVERNLERLTESLKRSQTESGLTPLEFILREFEDEAKKKLEENGLDSKELIELWCAGFDLEDCGPLSPLRTVLEDDYPSLIWPDEKAIQLQNAAHVGFCTDRVRRDIRKGDAEQTAIDMLKLCFATVNANFHEIIIRGIRAENAPKKKRRVREKPWFLLVLEYAKAKAQRKTFSGLITYLRAHHEGKEKPLKIDKGKVYLELSRKGDYRLNYKTRNKKESIGSEAFRKRFQELKKLGS